MSDPIAARYEDGFSFFGNKSRMREFIETPECETYLHRPKADGIDELHLVKDGKGASKLEPGEILMRVNRRPFDAELVFPQLESEDGQQFDLTLSLVWRIGDPRLFLRDYGLTLLKTQVAINPVSIEGLLTRRCKEKVTDEMRTVTYEYLKNRVGLSERWWASQLPDWARSDWLKLDEVMAIRYDSPTVDHEMKLKRHEQLAEVEREAKTRQQTRELEDKQREAAKEEGLRDIALNTELSEMERQYRAEVIRYEHENAVMKKKKEQLEMEMKRAKLEVEIADIRNHAGKPEERRRQAKESEEQVQNMLAAVQKAQGEFTEAIGMLKAAAAQGVADGKRLSDHTVNISPETLALVGSTDNLQYLTAITRAKANASPGAVSLKKVDLKSRDIGSRRVKSLRLGSSLEFELTSRSSGHISVLNIGTSGAVYLLAPNGIVSPANAQVQADRGIDFPGSPLLPGHPLYENGPPGWEELIVIISTEPLFTDHDLSSVGEDEPEVRLTSGQIGQLLEQLSELPEDAWEAGLLGFLVEG